MHELSPSNRGAFLERFGDFHDALIRDIHTRFGCQRDRRHGEPAGVIIIISVQDLGTRGQNWINVTLDIEAVSEMKLALGNWSTAVIYSLSIEFLDGNIYLSKDIGEEANTIDECKDSSFWVIGEKCTWSSSAYQGSVV